MKLSDSDRQLVGQIVRRFGEAEALHKLGVREEDLRAIALRHDIPISVFDRVRSRAARHASRLLTE